MPTIAYIQSSLLSATRTGDVQLLNMIFDDLAVAQIAQILPTTLTESLNNLNRLPDTVKTAAMMRAFMTVLGDYLEPAPTAGLTH